MLDMSGGPTSPSLLLFSSACGSLGLRLLVSVRLERRPHMLTTSGLREERSALPQLQFWKLQGSSLIGLAWVT